MKALSLVILSLSFVASSLGFGYEYSNFCKNSRGIKEIAANIKCRQGESFEACEALLSLNTKSEAEKNKTLNMYLIGQTDEFHIKQELDKIIREQLSNETVQNIRNINTEPVVQKIIAYIKSTVISNVSELASNIVSDLTGVAAGNIKLAIRIAMFAIAYKSQIANGELGNVAAGAAYTAGMWYLGALCPKCMAVYVGFKIGFAPTELGCGENYAGMSHWQISPYLEAGPNNKCQFIHPEDAVAGQALYNLIALEMGNHELGTPANKEEFRKVMSNKMVCEYYTSLHKKSFNTPVIAEIKREEAENSNICKVEFKGSTVLNLVLKINKETDLQEIVTFQKNNDRIGRMILFDKQGRAKSTGSSRDEFFNQSISQFKLYGSTLVKCCNQGLSAADCNKKIQF